MKREATVLLADEHPVFRRGLRAAFTCDPGLHVVAEAGDGAAAIRAVMARRPRVAVLGLEVRSALDVVRAGQSAGVATRFVVLAGERVECDFNEAMDLGVLGFLLKRCAVTEVVAAVRAVAEGEAYLCPCVSTWLLRRVCDMLVLRRTKPGLNSLTASERRILKLVAAERTSKDIADELGISYRTVENHRAHVASKLGLHGSHSVLKFAFDHKAQL